MAELIKSKGHSSKTGSAENYDFNQSKGSTSGQMILIKSGSEVLIKV